MTLGIADVLVYGLASGAVVDLWRNGSFLAGARAKVEARGGAFAALVRCDFCLTFQAALWLVAGRAAAGGLLPVAVGPVDVAVVALAVGRAAWIVNGLLPERLRHDRLTDLES